MQFIRGAVLWLVAITTLVFLLVSFLVPSLQESLALYFPGNESFRPWQYVTSMFVHAGIVHLLFNMYGLWAFGSQLEANWGTPKFVTFYFVAGFGAGLVYTIANYYQFNGTYEAFVSIGYSADEISRVLSDGRVDRAVFDSIAEAEVRQFFAIFHRPAVGASGAIYGILIAYAMTYPNAKLMLIFLPFPIAAKFFVPFLVGADVFFGLTKYSVGNIAHFAHIGGALCGLLIMLFWKPRRSAQPG